MLSRSVSAIMDEGLAYNLHRDGDHTANVVFLVFKFN